MPDLPVGFVPDSAVKASDIRLAPASQEVPAGFVPDKDVSADAIQPIAADAPVGFVPDSEVKPESFLTHEQYLSKLPHAQIVREVPAQLAKAYVDGTLTKEQEKELAPYRQAFRDRADRQEFIQTNDLPPEMRPAEAPVEPIDTGNGALDTALNLLTKPIPDSVLRMGQAMATGLVKQGQEIVKGAIQIDPLTGQQVSDADTEKAKANVVNGFALGTFQAANMLRTFVNRVSNKLFDDSGVIGDGTENAPKRPSMYRSYDEQFRHDLQAKQIEDDLIAGRSVVAKTLGSGEGLNRSTDPKTVEEISASPFSQPPIFIPGLGGLRAVTAEGAAARLLTGETKTAATVARQMAGKAAAVPVELAAKVPKTAARVLENNPLMAGVVAGTGTALGGGDAKDVIMASLLGVSATKVGALAKAAGAIDNEAAKLAGKVPSGPMGRFAIRAFDATEAGLKPIVASQLANTPFLLGADDEDSFKSLLAGGVLAHAAGHASGSLTNALDINRNIWATRETLPEVRTPVKDLGVDPDLDAAHLRTVETLGNSGNNFVQAVRDYFGKRGELYTLFPQDYAAALDRAQAAGHLDPATAQQAKAQQGITFTVPGEDGPRRVALSKVGRTSPGISVGHESGHLLEQLLSPDELNSIYKQIGETYGPEQLALYKDKYEQLANRTLGPDDPPVRLDDRSLLSEIFAEHASAVLNSIPIAQFSDPSMRGAPDLNRNIYSLIGRGLEKIGAKAPELAGGAGTKTGTGIEPSAKLGHLIENVLQAYQFDQPVLEGKQKVGEPIAPRTLEVTPDAVEVPNSRPVVEKPAVQGFKKGDPIGEVWNSSGVLLAEDAKVLRPLDTLNGERHYEIEYIHPDTGERLIGDVPEGWLVSPKGEPKVPQSEVVYPKSPVGSESPQGARVRRPDGRVKVGGELETPTDLIDSRSALPAPQQIENTTRAQGEAPVERVTPNVRTTRARQKGFETQGTPEEQLHNEAVFRKAAADRSTAHPFEIEHFGAKSSVEAPDQVVRERQRLAAEAEPNKLKQIWQKVFVPFKVNDTASGKTVFGLSMDKVIQNVDILTGWQKQYGGVDPYLTSPELARDIQNYLNNQANGYGGDGRRLTLPPDTKPNTITPENKAYTPVPISEDKMQKINLLMGYNLPENSTSATRAANDYFKRFAELNQGKLAKLSNGLTEVNLYRDMLRKSGLDLNVLNQATEQIRLRDIVGKAKPRPDLNFKAGDTGITKAGFMPAPAPETPAFKEWFGDSKVVDELGRPKKMYHGTTQNVDSPEGVFWITDSPKKASEFADRAAFSESERSGFDDNRGADEYSPEYDEVPAAGQNVLPVYASIKKPLDLTELGQTASLRETAEFLAEKNIIKSLDQDILDEIASELSTEDFAFTSRTVGPVYRMVEALGAHADIKKAGYDGVKMTDTDVKGRPFTAWASFEPEQIKSAIGNKGTFDKNNPDIRFMPDALSQIDTPTFKKWFGDSKVVDANNKPIVVYHGTDADFSIFDSSKLGKNKAVPSHIGFWFSDDPQYAGFHGDTIMPAYLSLQNPKKIKDSDALQRLTPEKIDALKKEGYDGVFIPSKDEKLGRLSVRTPAIYAAFRPEQIKSAVGNKGTFDATNPDIRFMPEAPAEYKGLMDLGVGPPLLLYNLTADIPGHPKGSTVSAQTLTKAGFTLPPKPLADESAKSKKKPLE